MKTQVSCFIAVLAFGSAACGGSTGNKDNGGGGTEDSGAPDAQATVDSGTPVVIDKDAGSLPDAGEADAGPVDHGAPSSTYPAFTPDVGQVQDNGGYVMKHPVIVPITWVADGSQANFDTFADEIGPTAYWKATTSEYGVGAAVSDASHHVHITTAPPPTIQDSDLQNLVMANAGAPTSDAGVAGWPAPTQDTIYAFFLPPKTSLLQSAGGGTPQDSCAQGVGGYHDQVTVGSVTTSYAVVPSCVFDPSMTAEQQTTESMSHELVEAATDPQPQATQNGYQGFDTDHFAWDYFQELQSEVGDTCEFYPQFESIFYEQKETMPGPFDQWVQRTWSNASIAAGHDPCVPLATPAYFNVTLLSTDMVHFTVPSQLTGSTTMTYATHGVLAPTGKSVTFPVGLYSDAPTSGPWTLSVAKGNPILPPGQSQLEMYNPSTVTATLDRTSGQNGEKVYVTVTVTSSGSLFAGEIVTVTSTLNGIKHYMPIWIAPG